MVVIEDDSTHLTDDGGVAKQIAKEGDPSQKPSKGDEVEVHYVGTLLDGTQFDSSRERGTPFSFRLGQGSVIKGWEIAVASMCKGEIANITVDSKYGYGDQDCGPIPKNSTLKFEVELLGFSEPMEADSSLNPEDSMVAAGEAKARGNHCFKLGEIEKAIGYYGKGKSQLHNHEEWSKDEQKKAEELLLGICLNLANCYIKLEMWSLAIGEASEALDIDAKNVKGLYRRAIGRLHFGMLTEAKEDLLQAASLEPKNAEVRRELEKVKELMKIQRAKEKATYQGMFDKMKLYKEKKDGEGEGVTADGGEETAEP